MDSHRQRLRRLGRVGNELRERYDPQEWCHQRRVIRGGLVVFALGACAILLWQPAFIADFPLDQFLDGYVVSGLLVLGIAAAGCGTPIDALTFGLYALGYGILVAPSLSTEIAVLGAISCFSLTALLADTRRTKDGADVDGR
ncbi:hypothetical protein [Halocatena pleomorpha]|uniref:Uncharacterized protein n=1 Tax=Halocatena pleomorpha TaxID=1785090 RepID=A0A3P3RBL5_9EURY|nr:hypothetical protein [Halocatena pleomorpha]RRJ30359.1 hypothetical protein EIK79_10600 [Halocatena pleomorpha]